MVTMPRKALVETLARAGTAGGGVVTGHFTGSLDGSFVVDGLGTDEPTPGLSPVGKFRARSGGAAVPDAEDAAGLRPGAFLMLVAVRGNAAAEWACWTVDGRSPVPMPLAVRMVD